MSINPESIDFIKRIENEFQNEIITPHREWGEFISLLKDIYSLEKVPLEEAYPKVERYITCNKDKRSFDAAFRVRECKSTEMFYKYNMIREVFRQNIYILMDSCTEQIFSNCALLDMKSTILRGIEEKDIVAKSQYYKHYLNTLYVYNKAQIV